MRGRATVMNSLILSRLWHVLRLVPLSKQQLTKIRSIAYRFMNHGMFPKIGFDRLTLPRKDGGVGLLDPATQQKFLQRPWVKQLLGEPRESSFVSEIDLVF